MLLEFRVKNYKSFVEEAVFSMLAAPKQKGLNYSVYQTKINRRNVKVLCSSVIYGPNASGKSNVISAMDTLRSIVLRGHIRNNSDESNLANPAADVLELIPNKDSVDAEPIEFYVDFLIDNIQYTYSVAVDLGTFLDASYERAIRKEEFRINGNLIFNREKSAIYLGETDYLQLFIDLPDGEIGDNFLQVAEKGLSPDELFLVNGFKQIYAPELVKRIVDWFANQFMVVCRADSMQLVRRFGNADKHTIYVEKTTNEAAKAFGITSNAVGYVENGDDTKGKLCSLLQKGGNSQGTAIEAEVFESYGTIRFVNLFPLVIRAMKTGATLVVDEFDASIHPMALMNIINIFHNDDINKKHAQLIFNTHNPIFLNSNLFRRDEIKFVERDDETHESVLYSLSDFGTTGEKGVRLHEDYLKNYFVNQYGAIRSIDFTPIFEEIMESEV